MVARSKGGWSPAKVTASAAMRPAAVASAMRSLVTVAVWPAMAASASA